MVKAIFVLAMGMAMVTCGLVSPGIYEPAKVVDVVCAGGMVLVIYGLGAYLQWLYDHKGEKS